jgi:hypothetical protein
MIIAALLVVGAAPGIPHWPTSTVAAVAAQDMVNG